MYKLYNVKRWGSIGIHLLLEELDVPYANVWMTPEQVKAPEFRDLSPLGLIPAMGLPDGETMIESAAMVSYLVTAHADRHMAPPPATSAHAMFLSWLHFMSTNIYPMVDLAGGHAAAFAADAAQERHIQSVALRNLREHFAIIEAHLQEEGPYMAGEAFSALDIYLFMLTIWAKPSQAEVLREHPAIAAVCAAVRERPKLKAALEAHGVLAKA